MKEAVRASFQVLVNDDDTLSTWHLVVAAPDDPHLMYHGGTFHIVVTLPDDYPSAAPVLRFATPVFHVNVSRDGRCCHSLLDRDYASEMPLSSLLPGVVLSLFAAPEPSSPLNKELAALYFQDEAENAKRGGNGAFARYELVVREGVHVYARRSVAELVAGILTRSTTREEQEEEEGSSPRGAAAWQQEELQDATQQQPEEMVFGRQQGGGGTTSAERQQQRQKNPPPPPRVSSHQPPQQQHGGRRR